MSLINTMKHNFIRKTTAVMVSFSLLFFSPGLLTVPSRALNAEQPQTEGVAGDINDDGNGNEEFQNSPVYVPADQTFGNSRYGQQANTTMNRIKQKAAIKWFNVKNKFSSTTGINMGRPTAQPMSHFGRVTFMDRIRNLTRGYIGGSRSVGAATTFAGGAGPAAYVGAGTGSMSCQPPSLSNRGKGRGKTFALGVAVGAGAVIAAPFIATAVGAGAGVTAALGGGLFAMIAGAAGAVLGGAASVLGFITGLAFSPIFLPALLIGGAIALAWYLLKKRNRQNPGLGNGGTLPNNGPVGVGGTSPNVDVIPGGGNTTPPSPDVNSTPVVTPGGPAAPSADASELQAAYQRYISSYNKYLGIVNYTPGATTPDQAMQNNLNSPAAQSALKEYKDSYNEYIKLRTGK